MNTRKITQEKKEKKEGRETYPFLAGDLPTDLLLERLATGLLEAFLLGDLDPSLLGLLEAFLLGDLNNNILNITDLKE